MKKYEAKIYYGENLEGKTSGSISEVCAAIEDYEEACPQGQTFKAIISEV